MDSRLIFVAIAVALLQTAAGKSVEKRDAPHRPHSAPTGYQQVFIRPSSAHGGTNAQSVNQLDPYDITANIPDYSIPDTSFPISDHHKAPTATTKEPHYGAPVTQSTAGYGQHQETGYGSSHPTNQGPPIPAYTGPQSIPPANNYGAPMQPPTNIYGPPTSTPPPHSYSTTTTTPRSTYGPPTSPPQQAIALQPVVDSDGKTIGYLIPAAVVRPDGPSVFAIVPNKPPTNSYGPPPSTTSTTTTTTSPPPVQPYGEEPQFSLVPVVFQPREPSNPHSGDSAPHNAYANL